MDRVFAPRGKQDGSPELLYTPNVGFIGVDTILFHTFDGGLSSAVAQIYIRVEPVSRIFWLYRLIICLQLKFTNLTTRTTKS
eukprot:m.350566 g.350566  ORF g.350566 m.350566 type:complete len:82 (-) comp48175_c0_seq1:658-903(-)